MHRKKKIKSFFTFLLILCLFTSQTQIVFAGSTTTVGTENEETIVTSNSEEDLGLSEESAEGVFAEEFESSNDTSSNNGDGALPSVDASVDETGNEPISDDTSEETSNDEETPSDVADDSNKDEDSNTNTENQTEVEDTPSIDNSEQVTENEETPLEDTSEKNVDKDSSISLEQSFKLHKGKINSGITLESLNKAFSKNGKVRVIVQLDEDFTPEGKLSKTKKKQQKEKINKAQEEVIKKLNSKNAALSKKITKFETIPFIALEVTSEELQLLLNDGKVKKISEDIEMKLSDEGFSSIVDDPIRPQLHTTNNLMNTSKAWDAGYTGQGVTVAILDSGVDKDHPFLANKVVSEACYDIRGGCPGGVTESTQPGSAYDYDSHGTHVAGIAAGVNSQFSGVAKDANIIAINVFGQSDTSYFSDQVKGLERVYALKDTYNISSVNVSIGGGRFYAACDSQLLSYKNLIDNLKSVGIATVIASGNEYYKDSISAPACISSAISVGATTNYDSVASFSNSAYFLTMLAPGAPVYSSIPNGGYTYMQGTSMATPQVTGAFALVKQMYPHASIDEMLQYLVDNGVSVTDTNGITRNRLDFSWMESVLPVLDTVPKPTWDNNVIQWDEVSNTSEYEVKLYKGNDHIYTERVGQYTTQYDTTSLIQEPGVYYVTVKAIGDNINYQDGPESERSDGKRKGVVYFEDFEENDGNFSVTGYNSSWQWGSPTSGPGTAHSGSNVWGTNLYGDYNNGESSYVISPSIDLSKTLSPIMLTWQQYAITENNYDDMTVEISKDDGQSWETIYYYTGNINSEWTLQSVEIDSSYAVNGFKIRFGIDTDGSVSRAGVYIDDVTVFGQQLQTKGYVETPTESSTINGIKTIRGWVLDGSGVNKIEVLVDGTKVGEAQYGIERNDVYNIYPEYNNRNSGFTYNLNTGSIANGQRTITIRSIGNDGKQTNFTRNVNIQNNLPLRGYIDAIKDGQRVKGTLPIKGWMLSAGGMNRIEVFVDNVKLGEAFYGIERADVYDAYPLYNERNSGFAFQLDTTKLTNGNKTVTVRGIDRNGQQINFSRNIVVDNLATRINIDSPSANNELSNSITVRGWALDQAGIRRIEVLIDGVKKGEAYYGLTRNDVYSAYPQYNESNSGYTFTLDTTSIANGQRTLTIRTVGRDGTINQVNRTIKINNLSTKITIESPSTNGEVSNTTVIRGWALGESGIKKIEILVDGIKNGEAFYGLSRPDVYNSYPQYNNQNPGYSYNLDTTKLSLGSHTITVRTVANNGKVTEMNRNVKVVNLATRLTLDTPSYGSTVNGVVTVKGWLLDQNEISKIEVFVDNIKQGEAYYGLKRNDVFLAYPEYNNTNSGYVYNLDTRALPNGTHKIIIRSVSNSGAITQISRDFVVSN